MDIESLNGVLSELSPLLTDAKIDRIFERGIHEICVVVRRKSQKLFLLISPARSMPRLHLLVQKPAAVPPVHAFTLFLKSRIEGGRITRISLLNQDRVVEIKIARAGTRCALIMEMIGAAANLVITDEAGTILNVYYPTRIDQHAARPLMPGIPYVLPAKKNILSAGITRPAGNPVVPGRRNPETSVNREIESYYDRLIKQERFESSRRHLLAMAKKAAAKAERRLEALSSDARTVHSAEEFRQAGGLILANIDSIRAGMQQALLQDFEGGQKIVPLNPALSGVQNAESYFKRYRKAKAGRSIITARISETEAELAFLGSVRSDIEQAGQESDLTRISIRLSEKGYRRSSQQKGKKERARPVPVSSRKIIYKGWEIMVGKSASGNDRLAKTAGPHDLWLHAEGIPGSHVVIRNPEKTEIPADVLEKAASLAAWHSRARAAGRVSVTYTPARFVFKPKGAKAGLVTLAKRKSLVVPPCGE